MITSQVSGSSILGSEAACWSSISQPISPCHPRRPGEVERSGYSGKGKPSASCQWRLWSALFFPRQLGAARMCGEWHSQTGLAHLSSCAWHGCLVSKQLQWVTDHLQIVNDTFVLGVHCHREEGKSGSCYGDCCRDGGCIESDRKVSPSSQGLCFLWAGAFRL